MRANMKSWLRRNGVDFYWRLQIPFLANALPTQLPNSVLFVCKGNICRSPFAEHLASKLAAQYGLTKMTIASAGLRVLRPLSPPEESIAAARAFGLDLSQHRSRSLDEMEVNNFHMIIVMEPFQLRALCRAFPGARKKVWLLTAFDNKKQISNHDAPRHAIPDPFGKTQVEFDACFKRIESCIVHFFSILNACPCD